ncbi:MAG TPA: DUF177 domain-containing protein [Mycobacteriales bacterium]|nr:DUF177 domain-containing protein [Mycobacteriales bacterium]
MPAPRLDPRQPLVIDTRELGRRPGSMRPLRLRVPAPASLGFGMIAVPDGAELDLDLRLESVMEGVLVSGRAHVPLEGECGRCLDPITSSVDVDLQELFAYPESHLPDDDAEHLIGDLLDLEPTLRDAVVLELPLTPLCSAQCQGLCVTCGAKLADGDCGHGGAPSDPRWAALENLTTAPQDIHQHSPTQHSPAQHDLDPHDLDPHDPAPSTQQ